MVFVEVIGFIYFFLFVRIVSSYRQILIEYIGAARSDARVSRSVLEYERPARWFVDV